MSSHHIVRDDQEPALIIANGESCSRELLDQLLEWNPLVIVLDSAMDRVIELGIKVDVLIGDFDRDFDANSYKDSQYPLEIIHVADQDSTDLEKAFYYLIDKKIPMVNVVWATGRRMDHTLANITCLPKFEKELKIVIIDDYSKVFLLPKSFKKWYPKKTILSLIPIGNAENITTTNLFYSLENESLQLGDRISSSNEVLNDGIVEIIYENGNLLLIESWD